MPWQTFGWTNKEYYGIFDTGSFIFALHFFSRCFTFRENRSERRRKKNGSPFELMFSFHCLFPKVCSEEKSCQVRRVRAVQNLLIKIGYGDIEESVPGNLSPSSGWLLSFCINKIKVHFKYGPLCRLCAALEKKENFQCKHSIAFSRKSALRVRCTLSIVFSL